MFWRDVQRLWKESSAIRKKLTLRDILWNFCGEALSRGP